ncbi:MAG TPA: hypothetical protein VGP72_13505 [Planctomycetota bacterium]|jgi:hypothetical protein
MRALLLAACIAGMTGILLPGCSKPATPSLTGVNMFHDITQVRKGMSPNEVERIMGAKYKTVYEEGLRGMDGGNYIWDYPEGRVYFGMNGVTRTMAKEK